eukprot:COSAG01_NODE_910_length_12784_cov_15.136460_2_plen_757_part_00
MYGGYDVKDPTAGFALMYGTRSPTFKELTDTFLPPAFASTLQSIPALKVLNALQLGPYNKLYKAKCSANDIAIIDGGCAGLTNAACYNLFKNCYFVAWAAPLGLAGVQTKLAGFKGPSAVVNALPSGSYFGASGSLSLKGVGVMAAAFETGLVIPGIGTTSFKFQTGIRLFDFFLGEAYFSYNMGLSASDQTALVAAAPKCVQDPPKCVAPTPHANCDKKAKKWLCKKTKPKAGSNGDANKVKSILPSPIISVGGKLALDMAKLKTQLKGAVTAMFDAAKQIKRLEDLLKQGPGKICKSLGVPNSICKVIKTVSSAAVNAVVSPVINGVLTVLRGIKKAIEFLIDMIPNTSMELAMDMKVRQSTIYLEGAMKFKIEMKRPRLAFTLQIGQLQPFKPLKFCVNGVCSILITIADYAVKGLKDQIGKAAGVSKPDKVLKNGLKKAKTALVDKGKKLMKALESSVKTIGAAIGFRQGSRTCGKQSEFGFTYCRTCDESPRSARGPRRQHVIHRSAGYETCFGKCFEISMLVYDAWTEATLYEAVKYRPSVSWLRAPERLHLVPADSNDECEGLCTSDVDCVGYSYLETNNGATKKCSLMTQLPPFGPWRCKAMSRETGSPKFYDCRQKYWHPKTNYATVDPATCGVDGSCFYRRVTKADGVTHQNPHGLKIDGKMVSYRFGDGEVDTATVRDWTSNSCCRRNGNNNVCIFAPGSGKKSNTNDKGNAATGNVWCDSTYEKTPGTSYEPTRCAGGYSSNRG